MILSDGGYHQNYTIYDTNLDLIKTKLRDNFTEFTDIQDENDLSLEIFGIVALGLIVTISISICVYYKFINCHNKNKKNLISDETFCVNVPPMCQSKSSKSSDMPKLLNGLNNQSTMQLTEFSNYSSFRGKLQLPQKNQPFINPNNNPIFPFLNPSSNQTSESNRRPPLAPQKQSVQSPNSDDDDFAPRHLTPIVIPESNIHGTNRFNITSSVTENELPSVTNELSSTGIRPNTITIQNIRRNNKEYDKKDPYIFPGSKTNDTTSLSSTSSFKSRKNDNNEHSVPINETQELSIVQRSDDDNIEPQSQPLSKKTSAHYLAHNLLRSNIITGKNNNNNNNTIILPNMVQYPSQVIDGGADPKSNFIYSSNINNNLIKKGSTNNMTKNSSINSINSNISGNSSNNSANKLVPKLVFSQINTVNNPKSNSTNNGLLINPHIMNNNSANISSTPLNNNIYSDTSNTTSKPPSNLNYNKASSINFSNRLSNNQINANNVTYITNNNPTTYVMNSNNAILSNRKFGSDGLKSYSQCDDDVI